MYRDNSLIPSEAVRLLALGILATGPAPYAELVGEVRHFTGHVVGPSLDLVGAPLEVLRVEGLIAPSGPEPDEPLTITEAGRQELRRLLNSNVRPPVTDVNKLIIAVKMRLLHLLEPEDRRLQEEAMLEMCERELVRLSELRARHAGAAGHLPAWLDHEIAQTSARRDWFRALLAAGP